jgi:NADPH:quinone reductase-like Zn-dependent oxidoreductase
MKAAVQERYGPPEIVEVREVERPVPKDGEVLVRVHAASVNRADLDGLKPRPRFVRLIVGLRAPRNTRTGIDVAGVVESIGAGVTTLKSGDAVFGDMFGNAQGAFAEFVCAPEKAFATIPPGMSMVDASTLPHSAVLALQGLRLRNGRTIKPGDRVLIDGASGNVGPFAVQIAKARGAEVTGVASGAKLDMVRSLGADHVIDYQQVDYTKSGQRYDWIVDTDSHHSMLEVRRALRPGGVYVTLGGWDARIFQSLLFGWLIGLATRRSMGLLLWWKPFHGPDVEALKELIAAGRLRAVIDRTYPLTEIVAALRQVDDGRAAGKVVVLP